jgi:hypothetical protein
VGARTLSLASYVSCNAANASKTFVGTIIHPKATIFAVAGPIVIGADNIIEEGAIVVNRRKEVMRIGDDNLFEIGCRTFYFSNASHTIL